MRALPALLLLVLLLPGAPALAADGAPRVEVELRTPSRTVFVMERVQISLWLIVDIPDFEARSVTLFNRPMNLQLKIKAPHLVALPGAIAVPPDPVEPDAIGFTLVVNDEVVSLTPIGHRDGSIVFELTRTWLPEKPGVLALTAPVATFAYTSGFEEDLIRGRQPLDRTDVTVTGDPLRISVRPIPEDGRPELFAGAVGQFKVTAAVEPPAVAVGDGLKLTLRIEGEGNLGLFDTPRLPALPGFHVYGALDDRATPVRTIVYDLTCIEGGVPGLLAIPFPYFDPTAPGTFRSATTKVIPIAVTGGGGTALPCGGNIEVEEPAGVNPIYVGVLVLLVVGGIVYAVLRARRSRRPAPESTPADLFLESLARDEVDLEAALSAYLAAHLSCAPAAVISPDLPRRLRAAGIPADLAERTAALVTGLVATRYGGEGNGDARESARMVVGELEEFFAAGEFPGQG